MTTLPINQFPTFPPLPHDVPTPPAPAPRLHSVKTEALAPSFADTTKVVVEEIVTRCADELQTELTQLHKMLDDFEQASIVSAAGAKNALESYIETIQYGHQLTALILERLDNLRRDQARAFSGHSG